MDRLDRIAFAAVIILVLATVVLIRGHHEEPRHDPEFRRKIAAENDPSSAAELSAKARIARTLIDARNFDQAETLIREMQQQYPYGGEPHMLMGDLLMRKQEPVRAVHEYKLAIEYNPDYLDKKTPQFQGKKLKVAVGEALAAIESRLKSAPGDASLRSEKKVIYYLYRKIAGSCG